MPCELLTPEKLPELPAAALCVLKALVKVLEPEPASLEILKLLRRQQEVCRRLPEYRVCDIGIQIHLPILVPMLAYCIPEQARELLHQMANQSVSLQPVDETQFQLAVSLVTTLTSH